MLLSLGCIYRLTQASLSDKLLSLPSHRALVRPSRGLPRLAIPAAVSYWVFWSYRPLVNHFTWNFSEVSVLNSETSLQPLNAFIALALFI